ncbi:MAG: F0F1 ATP synthase subunit B [Acidobacteriota bacterium]|jgi:F-type H+-transporting ATPase subunit b
MERLISPDTGMILWTLITFGILVVILRLFAWKPLLGVLDERERTVRESLESAEKAREDAETVLEENRRILAEARRASGDILQKAGQEAEQVKSGIMQKAREEQEELLERGRAEIEREKRAAIREIRGVAADLAMSAAEKLLESKLDDEANRRLVEGYLEDLEEAGPRTAQ